MPARASNTDPRSVVTPEAFTVSPELLGLPLASPGRRLAAILIDLVCIGILTAVTRNFALVFGIVVGGALLRASTRRTEVRGSVFDRARRFSIGCLGVFIGLMTILIGTAILFQDDLEELGRDLASDVSGVTLDLTSDGVRVSPSTRTAAPDSTPTDAEPIELRDLGAVRDGVSLYSAEEALDAYIELRREGAASRMDEALLVALEERLAREFASDTLIALEERIGDLERDAIVAQARLREAEEELDDAVSGGFLSWIRGLLDDLGLGFGWAALYTTVLLAWTNGQTLGKRLLGIRVLRLDAKPITWWVGFERAGGYAAGFATGLLGFAQVYWDANRQAIHDRIVGTVVVREGAERVQDWEATL